MKVFERVRIVRVTKGFTQKQVAAGLEMAISTYNSKETGNRAISIDDLEAISKLLKVSITIFFEDEFHVKWNNINSSA